MRLRNLDIPQDDLRAFCERHRIRRLAVFGSAVRDDFSPASDVDIIAEFAAGERVGLIRLGTVEAELSDLLGRRVDLNLSGMLSPHFRAEALAEAEVVYDAA